MDRHPVSCWYPMFRHQLQREPAGTGLESLSPPYTLNSSNVLAFVDPHSKFIHLLFPVQKDFEIRLCWKEKQINNDNKNWAAPLPLLITGEKTELDAEIWNKTRLLCSQKNAGGGEKWQDLKTKLNAESASIKVNNQTDLWRIWWQREHLPRFPCGGRGPYVRTPGRGLSLSILALQVAYLKFHKPVLCISALSPPLHSPTSSLLTCILSWERNRVQLLYTNHPLAEVFGGSQEREGEKIRKISISGPLLFSLIIRGAVTPVLIL